MIDQNKLPPKLVNKLEDMFSNGVHIVTHDGPFHGDEVLAILILEIIFNSIGHSVNITRTRSPHAQGNIFIDVGNKCSLLENTGDVVYLDHHHDRLLPASCSLVLKWLSALGDFDVKKAFPQLYLMSTIVSDNDVGNRKALPGELADMVKRLNSTDPYNSDIQSDAFYNVLRLLRPYVKKVIEADMSSTEVYNWFSTLPCLKVIYTTPVDHLGILDARLLPPPVPNWTEYIESSWVPTAKYILLPGKFSSELGHDTYTLRVIPDSPGSFTPRSHPCPQADNSKIHFVHNSGFMAVATDEDQLYTYIVTDLNSLH